MKASYNKENFEKIVKESKNITDVIVKLGLQPKGGNYRTVAKYIRLYNIDTSHFGTSVPCSKLYITNKTTELEEILRENTSYPSNLLKQRLIRMGYKENCCECCGISKWNDKEITLELHHINGDHFDNRIENLQILCPNCHSQTNTFRKNNKRQEKKVETVKFNHTVTDKICPNCQKQFKPKRNKQTFCSVECALSYAKLNSCLSQSNHDLILYDDLISIVNKQTTVTEISKKYSVNRTTVYDHLRYNNLYEQYLNNRKNKTPLPELV